MNIDPTALITAMLATAITTSCGRFQYFTRNVGRSVVGFGPGADLAAAQRVMSPAWLGMLMFLGYLLDLVSAYFGVTRMGWWWLGVLAVLSFLLPGFLGAVWPWPTRAQMQAWAEAEAHRSMGEATSRVDRDQQQLCSAVLIELMTLG